jgi:hypothetical protein
MKKKGYFHGSSLKFARVVTMMYLQWWMKSAPKKTKTTASINNRQPPGRYVTYTAQKEQENKKKRLLDMETVLSQGYKTMELSRGKKKKSVPVTRVTPKRGVHRS